MHIFTKRTFTAALILLATPVIAPAAANAASIQHTLFMRGSVIAIDNGTAVVCIGSADGAKPGQTLSVVRAETIPSPSSKGGVSYRRREIGSVTIQSIIDEHFARATIDKGDVRRHDLVELRKD